MDPLTLTVIAALLSTAGSLGLTLGQERLSTKKNRDVVSALERATRGSRQRILAGIWSRLTQRQVDAVLSFLDSGLGRHSMRTLVVASLTSVSDVTAAPVVDAMRAQGTTEDDQLLTMLELSMLVTQCVPVNETRECASVLLATATAITSDIANQLRRLKPEDYRIIRQALMADRQADLVSNLGRSNGTLHDLIHVDASAARLFAQRIRPLVHDKFSTVDAPYFQKRPPIPYSEIYVAPVLDRGSESGFNAGISSADDGEPSSVAVEDLLSVAYREVILGSPGAGKSTALRYMASLISSPGYKTGNLIPLFVSIRDYDSSRRSANLTLCEYIGQALRRDHQLKPPPAAIEYLCATGAAALLLDGLDEVLEPHHRKDLVTAISSFCALYPATPVIVTSRAVGYDQAPLYAKVFNQTRLSAFTDVQVALYAAKWFAGELDMEPERRGLVIETFLADLRSVGEDLRSNPLTLSLLCNVYRRIRSIPQSRADLYEDCAKMLFETWDRSRGIMSDAGVLRGEAMDALQDVALWMYTRALTPEVSAADEEPSTTVAVDSGIMNVSRSELRRRLVKYWKTRVDSRSQAEEMADSLISSWEGRAWILTDVGSDLEESRYGFTHQTFLEYFAANEFVRKHPSPPKLAAALMPRLAVGAWDVVGEIAAQVINRNVRDGCDKLAKRLIHGAVELPPVQRSAIAAFITRHFDSLPLSAPTKHMVVREAVQLYLQSQPVFAHVPKWREYDEQLWFRTELNWFLQAPHGENGDVSRDVLASYFALGRDELSEQDDGRSSYALPFLALMRSRVPESVDLIRRESVRELVRIASAATEPEDIASAALIVLMQPGQIDFSYHELLAAYPATWQFGNACVDALSQPEIGSLCRRLYASNFVLAALGAVSGDLEPELVLAGPSGWPALFVTLPAWFGGLVPEDEQVRDMPAAMGWLTDTVDCYTSKGELAATSSSLTSMARLGTWLVATLLERGWKQSSDAMTWIDRDWLSEWSLQGWLYEVMGASALRTDPLAEDWSDNPASVAEDSEPDPLVTALGHEGLCGLFFTAMVWFDAVGLVHSRAIEGDRLGSLKGLADLLDCRVDGVPFLRTPWPGARHWKHSEMFGAWLSAWTTGRIELTSKSWARAPTT